MIPWHLVFNSLAQATTAAAFAAPLLVPAVILVLCVIAGCGTLLALPSRKEAPWTTIGVVLVLAAGLILVALLVRNTGGAFSAVGGRGCGMGFYFWVFCSIAISAAFRVITHPRPIYSALYFVLTVLAAAGLLILLWAEFVAVALVVIYAGAILVTYVFVIMLAQQAPATPGSDREDCDRFSREPALACAIGFVMGGIFLFVIFDKMPVEFPRHADAPQAGVAVAAPGVRELGQYLFSPEQLINVELAGVILTLAMVGAIIIARRRVAGGTIVEDEPPAGLEPSPASLADNPHDIPVYGDSGKGVGSFFPGPKPQR